MFKDRRAIKVRMFSFVKHRDMIVIYVLLILYHTAMCFKYFKVESFGGRQVCSFSQISLNCNQLKLIMLIVQSGLALIPLRKSVCLSDTFSN